MYLGILERFGGYTLASLMDEDVSLLRLLHIEKLGQRKEADSGEHS